MNKPTVAVIMVNWNGLEHLKLSLPSLRQQAYKEHTVFIVDNGSTDGSLKYIKSEFPEVRLIETGENLGFAGGNNVGMEVALKEDFDFIFLLNNDTTIQKDCLEKLVEYMEKHKKVGIAQPKLLLLDHPDRLDSCGSWLTKTGFIIHFGVEEKDAPQYNKVQKMFTIKGAAMIMRREMLEQIGLLDHGFFAYFEETDLCWRAWLRGWEVDYAPVSAVYHKMGGSTQKIGSPVINYHSFKNRIMSLIKNLAWYNVIWIVPIHLVLVLGFSFIYFGALRGRSGWAIYRAIGWNITHLGENLRKRREIQSKRVISDHDLFKIITRPINWLETFGFASRFFIQKKKTDLIAEGKWREKK